MSFASNPSYVGSGRFQDGSRISFETKQCELPNQPLKRSELLRCVIYISVLGLLASTGIEKPVVTEV